MENKALQAFEKQQLRKEYPRFQPGDTVRVHTRVIEGEKERIQIYEGVVIARQNGGISETFNRAQDFLWDRCGAYISSSFTPRR